MTRKENILILSAGRRVELVQAFKEAVEAKMPGRKVYAADMKPEVAPACHIADDRFLLPSARSLNYIDAILELVTRNSIGLVVPTIDTELLVLSENREKFEAVGCHLIIPDYDIVKVCRDKRKTAALFNSKGIETPKIYDRQKIVFPCFCKPYDGSCSVGAKVLNSDSELTPDLLTDEKMIFMELIGSDYVEYTVDAYYDRKGSLCCLVPRERIEVRGGEVSKGITRRDFVYELLVDKLHNLPGARGCLTIQVFVDKSNRMIRGIEINPRFGGGYPLTHAAGARYPEWLVREYLQEEKIQFFDAWDDNLLMLRYDAKILVRDAAI